ncbi:Nicotinamidase-related amidase [Flavobacterium aquidurense]|uniref:Isochorismatase n=1 Tax=Flavobacterium frigidimaris TaxID=262320 RepID=A0ABX4BW16_FLAFR|nr:isochorismatase family cysteine hydrolase [Flavobacterium frigidimaris]OXA81857.1 isochorismatase [Flavobacterium frigidimaris]SDZ34531.1 Nicotinamidase-related amidase [Flavobacterium aquidurense]
MNQNTALLVMDIQLGILGTFPNTEDVIKNITKAIAIARDKNIQIIFATLGFKNGAAEISPNNKVFSATREHIANINLEEFSKVHPALAQQENDIHVTKRRVSAFTGSELEVILRSKGIQHLILTGVATSGIVLSTTTEASDKDFKITVLSDGCADRDEEVHRVLTTKILLRHANVLTIDEWKNA